MANPKRQRNVTDQQASQPAGDGAVGANGASPEVDEIEVADEFVVDLDSVIAERDTYLDQLQRSVAEFANYRRRVDQERAQIKEFASAGLLAQIVPVLDDLQRALAQAPADQHETPWIQGVKHIERKLAGVLERAGVTAIDALGQPFDPALHEAVAQEPGSTGNTVIEIYQTGYRLGQGLLRPAMVKVGDEVVSSQ
ncbi:MAG: nucleotide exchange factor GrpE [Thermomicrobiales bacterium]